MFQNQVAKAANTLEEMDRHKLSNSLGIKRLNGRLSVWAKRSTTTDPNRKGRRPQIRFQRGAREWLRCKDNMLKVGIHHNGVARREPDSLEMFVVALVVSL